MPYGYNPTMADGMSGRDDIARALMNNMDPPPGGVHMPPGGIPPAAGQQPTGGAMAPPGGMGQQMAPTAPVGGMAGQLPGMQPAAFGTAPPPAGPMGPIGGPYSSQVRLPGVTPQF